MLGRLDNGTNESSIYLGIINQASDVPSIIFLSFECPKSIKSIKKMILGTSDSWSTIHLSHPPSNPSYYIVD